MIAAPTCNLMVEPFTLPTASPVKKLDLLSPKEYLELVTRLITNGEAAIKTAGVYAFMFLPTMSVTTLSSIGEGETLKEIAPSEELLLVFDGKQYTARQAHNAWQNIQIELGQQRAGLSPSEIAKINNGEAREVFDVCGIGIWTTPAKAFRKDYELQKSNFYKIKPDALRVCLPLEHDTGIMVQWGKFDIRAGGTLAVRPQDIPEIIKALEAVQSGQKTIEEALFKQEGDQMVAIFDIYGMEPGFYKQNYGPAKLDTTVLGSIQKFRQQIGGQKL